MKRFFVALIQEHPNSRLIVAGRATTSSKARKLAMLYIERRNMDLAYITVEPVVSDYKTPGVLKYGV